MCLTFKFVRLFDRALARLRQTTFCVAGICMLTLALMLILTTIYLQIRHYGNNIFGTTFPLTPVICHVSFPS